MGNIVVAGSIELSRASGRWLNEEQGLLASKKTCQVILLEGRDITEGKNVGITVVGNIVVIPNR